MNRSLKFLVVSLVALFGYSVAQLLPPPLPLAPLPPLEQCVGFDVEQVTVPPDPFDPPEIPEEPVYEFTFGSDPPITVTAVYSELQPRLVEWPRPNKRLGDGIIDPVPLLHLKGTGDMGILFRQPVEMVELTPANVGTPSQNAMARVEVLVLDEAGTLLSSRALLPIQDFDRMTTYRVESVGPISRVTLRVTESELVLWRICYPVSVN